MAHFLSAVCTHIILYLFKSLYRNRISQWKEWTPRSQTAKDERVEKRRYSLGVQHSVGEKRGNRICSDLAEVFRLVRVIVQGRSQQTISCFFCFGGFPWDMVVFFYI